MKLLIRAAVCGLAFTLAGPAAAQNLSLRAPAWAQPLLSSDIIPTTGGRAILNGEDIDLAVRVTVAPARGGVARVIRYDLSGDEAELAVRRFTGHPSTGWWLWGPDAPRVDAPNAAQRGEIATLARAAMGVGGSLGGQAGETCAAGEQAFVEIAQGERSTSFARGCVRNADAVGRLVLRLSELAGSRTEEELAAAAMAELMQADRAFAAMAREDGIGAAFTHYAAEDAIVGDGGEVLRGRDAIAARYEDWPEGAALRWTPSGGRVSARGDMGWTWGEYSFAAPGAEPATGHYVTVWTRDYEGQWRYAFDAAIQ